MVLPGKKYAISVVLLNLSSDDTCWNRIALERAFINIPKLIENSYYCFQISIKFIKSGYK